MRLNNICSREMKVSLQFKNVILNKQKLLTSINKQYKRSSIFVDSDSEFYKKIGAEPSRVSLPWNVGKSKS